MTYVYKIYDKRTEQCVPSNNTTFPTYESAMRTAVIYYIEEYYDDSNCVQIFEQHRTSKGNDEWECVAESSNEWDELFDKYC